MSEFEGMEGKHDWAGPWHLDRRDMIWRRPQHYYFRSAISGEVEQFTQRHMGPMIRPGPLRDIGQLLDVPMAVTYSHPDTPEILPEDNEGMWMSTNPAWPEKTIDLRLRQIGMHAVWEDSSQDNVETFKLGPHTLNAVIIYVKPGPEPNQKVA